MIRANMTEIEILKEAEERFEYQKKNFSETAAGHPFDNTLEKEIQFVRKMSEKESSIENEAMNFVEGYYQKFLQMNKSKWSAQSFYHRVIREGIRKEFVAQELKLIRSKANTNERKALSRKAEVLTAAARMAYEKYMNENNAKIPSGLTINPEWESQMVEELESKTEKEIM